ncbi:hypothetical protein VZT92_023756 [Zoarces viviparus]|uniref:C-type lectin domain-containing protein n=1 Tax=Zoarces viviparus TaxID=48416 RepID=A0AAW1E7V3_ZOAVI
MVFMEMEDDTFIDKNLTMEGLISQGQLIYHASRLADNTERDRLEGRLSNLTEEKGQLQQSYTALTTERDEFKNEKEELQNKYNSLAKVKDELEKEINKLREKTCQSGWSKFENSCYFVSTVKKNWASSRADCIAKGADLVIIDSRDEQVFVGLLPSGLNAWIGLTDSVTEGTWMWVDGTPVTTTYWQAGQPNGHYGDQDCGETIQRSSGVGEWNDEGCIQIQNFICEQ